VKLSRILRSDPITLGMIGTGIALVIGYLVWADNRNGFRDAGAMADLLAALFSMITTTWLIITVWIQRRELDLQREELALQRAESTRIADETSRQAKLMAAQLAIALKQSIVADTTAYLRTRIGKVEGVANELRAAATALAVQRLECAPEEIGARVFASNAIQFKHATKPDRVAVQYQELGQTLPTDLLLETLNKWYQRAKDADLEEWFRVELPYSVGHLEESGRRVTTAEIRLIIGVAAKMQFNL
jgi:hypothetical protein